MMRKTFDTVSRSVILLIMLVFATAMVFAIVPDPKVKKKVKPTTTTTTTKKQTPASTKKQTSTKQPAKKQSSASTKQSNQVVNRPQWKFIGDYHEGLTVVKDVNDKYGYIDKTGKVVE